MVIRVRRLPGPFAGFQGVCCWPFILIRADCPDEEGLLIHERVHFREQRACLLLPWLLLYLLSRRFRLAAEARAFAAQIRAGHIDLSDAAACLTRYRLGITRTQARAALERRLGLPARPVPPPHA